MFNKARPKPSEKLTQSSGPAEVDSRAPVEDYFKTATQGSPSFGGDAGPDPEGTPKAGRPSRYEQAMQLSKERNNLQRASMIHLQKSAIMNTPKIMP
jgi:hypothetical protein